MGRTQDKHTSGGGKGPSCFPLEGAVRGREGAAPSSQENRTNFQGPRRCQGPQTTRVPLRAWTCSQVAFGPIRDPLGRAGKDGGERGGGKGWWWWGGSQSWPRSLLLFRIWHQNSNMRAGRWNPHQNPRLIQIYHHPQASRKLSDLHLPGNPPDGHAAQELGDSTP